MRLSLADLSANRWDHYTWTMNLLKKPGASLLLIGAVLFFIVRPVVGKIWIVGGVASPIAWVVGLLGMVGGIYLLARSSFGTGNN